MHQGKDANYTDVSESKIVTNVQIRLVLTEAQEHVQHEHDTTLVQYFKLQSERCFQRLILVEEDQHSHAQDKLSNDLSKEEVNPEDKRHC